jgi:hypothetical protein
MKNYALINSENLVINTTLWDGVSAWTPPAGQQIVELTGDAGIGWSYIEGEFLPPPERIDA